MSKQRKPSPRISELRAYLDAHAPGWEEAAIPLHALKQADPRYRTALIRAYIEINPPEPPKKRGRRS